jgi:hypothetical protein
LLAKGLAERVEANEHPQIRITEAGRLVNREGFSAMTAPANRR